MSRTIIHLIFSPCSYAVYTTPTTSFATNDTPDYSTSSFVATVVLWATLGPHGGPTRSCRSKKGAATKAVGAGSILSGEEGSDPKRSTSVPPQVGGQVQQRHLQITFHGRRRQSSVQCRAGSRLRCVCANANTRVTFFARGVCLAEQMVYTQLRYRGRVSHRP